jgi:hypothetical protein
VYPTAHSEHTADYKTIKATKQKKGTKEKSDYSEIVFYIHIHKKIKVNAQDKDLNTFSIHLYVCV